MTLGLYLPNIPSSCVTARCLNNKHNVFFVAEKACKNLAVLISNCDSVCKKLKFCWHSLTTAGDLVRKFLLRGGLQWIQKTACRVRAAGKLPFHITEWVNIQLVARLVHILRRLQALFKCNFSSVDSYIDWHRCCRRWRQSYRLFFL